MMSSQDFKTGFIEMNVNGEMRSFIQDLHPTDTENIVYDAEIQIKEEKVECPNNTSTSDAEYDFYRDSDIKTMPNFHHVDYSSIKCEGNDLNELYMISENESARILIERLSSTRGSSQPTEDPLSIDHDSPPFDQSSFNPVKCEVDEDMEKAEYSEHESKPKCESDPHFDLAGKGNENDPYNTASSHLTQKVHVRLQDLTTSRSTTSDDKSVNGNEGIPLLPEQLRCFECDERFLTNVDLITHMRTHTSGRPYKCDACEKTFARTDHLTRHKLVHTGVKPYTCALCEKSFFCKSSLTKHEKIHTGQRPFKCDLCGKSFSQSNNLTRHKLVHSGEKSYTCDVCGKTFALNRSLTLHKKIHTGERAFKCDECEMRFTTSDILTKHKRIHTREKPFKCDGCVQSFSQKCHLTVHNRIHTGVRPYKCDVCEKSFTQLSHLTKHKRIHTGKKALK